MTRAARAVIDLSALRQNLQRARAAAPHSKQYAVIKANGYGHGMIAVARALSEADGFGVASLEEALDLRAAGINQPIVLLEGFFQQEELESIWKNNLEIVVHHEDQLLVLEKLTFTDSHSKKPLIAWLKVDTGMHRLGFYPDEVEEKFQRLSKCQGVEKPVRFMTHLANADDFYDKKTQQQIEIFKGLLSGEDVLRSIANSAGVLGWMGSYSDIARPGILLYGVSPFLKETAQDRGLLPVMTLRSEIIAVKQCRKGDAVGYGGTWTCPEDMKIGVVGIGYGDGYPRHAISGTPVLVNGKRVPLVGRVSMDMICVDLRDHETTLPGDEVILWGEGLPAEEVASSASTIAYELFCAVTSRVPREYINGEMGD
jgi:alanine racemase